MYETSLIESGYAPKDVRSFAGGVFGVLNQLMEVDPSAEVVDDIEVAEEDVATWERDANTNAFIVAPSIGFEPEALEDDVDGAHQGLVSPKLSQKLAEAAQPLRIDDGFVRDAARAALRHVFVTRGLGPAKQAVF